MSKDFTIMSFIKVHSDELLFTAIAFSQQLPRGGHRGEEESVFKTQ